MVYYMVKKIKGLIKWIPVITMFGVSIYLLLGVLATPSLEIVVSEDVVSMIEQFKTQVVIAYALAIISMLFIVINIRREYTGTLTEIARRIQAMHSVEGDVIMHIPASSDLLNTILSRAYPRFTRITTAQETKEVQVRQE